MPDVTGPNYGMPEKGAVVAFTVTRIWVPWWMWRYWRKLGLA